MKDTLDAFLALYSRETRENVLCLRKLILEALPKATEHIDLKAKRVTFRQDQNEIFLIVPQMKHVCMVFCQGARIPDPTCLLFGSGGKARHLKIRSEAETQNTAFTALLKEAAKLA